MKIDHIETVHLRFEYEQGFTYAGGVCSARLTSLVLVHTDDGRVGIGSAYSHPALVEIVVNQQLAPFLVGRDPNDVDELWWLMYRLTRWFGRKGAAMTALGALDTAFWDLRGQAAGASICRLLGGERVECPAYASSLLWKDPELLAQEAGQHLDAGFRRMKMRLGRGHDYDHAAVEAVCQTIKGRGELLVDGSMRYELETAAQLGRFLSDNDVFWFEEPFEPEQLDRYAELRSRGGNPPLAAGENEFGEQGFRELVRTKAVDILQPDASRCGGVSEVQRVAELAQQARLKFATHSWSDAVAIVANAHVVAAHEHGLTVEVDRTGNPFVEDLLNEPLTIDDGVLKLSDAPGLGVSLNQSVVDQFRLTDPFDIPDGSYSDMVFREHYYRPASPYGQ